MTDEEFGQMLQDIVAMSEAHPEINAVALGPDLIAEFEKRGYEPPLRPYPAKVIGRGQFEKAPDEVSAIVPPYDRPRRKRS